MRRPFSRSRLEWACATLSGFNRGMKFLLAETREQKLCRLNTGRAELASAREFAETAYGKLIGCFGDCRSLGSLAVDCRNERICSVGQKYQLALVTYWELDSLEAVLTRRRWLANAFLRGVRKVMESKHAPNKSDEETVKDALEWCIRLVGEMPCAA